uniref:palmitoyl-protein hydrolase n=1 Tax=Meloidogyne hapla TaxID=6305 RepID=A0A1I8BR52_MELHA
MAASTFAPPIIIRSVEKHTATLIFFHGLGDQGDGWSRYIFPNAQSRPVTLNFGMRMPAWYDILGLTANSSEDDQGIELAKNYVHGLISKEIDEGISSKRIVIGGFSMGGALALYLITLIPYQCQHGTTPQELADTLTFIKTSIPAQILAEGSSENDEKDQAITQLLKHIYCDKTGKWEDYMVIETIQKYKESKLFRWKLIYSVLDGTQLGKLNIKILHCACILLGNEETSQLFARFIHAAKDEKQLTNFLSFALTVIPHLNQNQRYNSQSVMTLAVRFAVLDSKRIENELTEFLKEKEEIFIENYNCQNKISLERNLLNNLLMIVKWNEQSEQGTILRNIGLNLADIRGHLQEGLLNWILDYNDFVRKITGGTLNESYKELFDSDCCGSNKTSRHVGAFLDYSKFKTIDFLNKNCEHSIFQELRQASLTDKSAAAVAHSGTLTRKRFSEKFIENKKEIEINQIRRLLFLDFIECLCLSGRPSKPSPPSQEQIQFYDLGMCRFLGQLLVDRFAGDGLTSHLCWHQWEQERELVSQYTKITKIIDQHPIVFDFLLLLSELGFTGLCSVIPLFKALFVTVLSQLENTPLKTEKISFAFLQRLNQIIGLFICLIIPTPEEITKGKMINIENKNVLEKKEGKQLISSMILVIQRNISLFGGLLSPILDLIGEKDENDWSIERELKPISVLAEIKRL